MARRTKADALATRDNILDCAEHLFVKQGVSNTTLQHIAQEARVTRGAIYWHFEDKVALLDAMLRRAKMPLESAMQTLDIEQPIDPLGDLGNYAKLVFDLMQRDPKACRVFEIATLKIEYVDEMTAMRERRADMSAQWMAKAESRIRFAVLHGQARPTVNPRSAALGLWAIIDGLARAWMIAPDSFELTVTGEEIVATHLNALRL